MRYAGEPVALVVAETLEAARDAGELVDVDYDPVPAAVSLDDALAKGAPLIWPERVDNRSLKWDTGDPAATKAAFDAATHVVELTVEYPREIIAFMEPRSALADYDAGSQRFTFRTGCQSGHSLKEGLSRIFGIDQEAIHVIVPTPVAVLVPATWSIPSSC